MKCILHRSPFRATMVARVRDDLALVMVRDNGWEYCPKSFYKRTMEKEDDKPSEG
jgi:hypothetical protein